MSDDMSSKQLQLNKITQDLRAMHLAQLTAFAFTLPPLYFCREYINDSEAEAINHCKQRLLNLLVTEKVTSEQLLMLLSDKEYYSEEEARLRLGPLMCD
ncbi:hypothetical protein [Psychromonas aquatilis]|uniref:Uncharacterized protein n=1 Tax=Psychromonas aquatilis TaxID=2005072 RepID=A0ABU9GT77_9GAMM